MTAPIKSRSGPGTCKMSHYLVWQPLHHTVHHTAFALSWTGCWLWLVCWSTLRLMAVQSCWIYWRKQLTIFEFISWKKMKAKNENACFFHLPSEPPLWFLTEISGCNLQLLYVWLVKKLNRSTRWNGVGWRTQRAGGLNGSGTTRATRGTMAACCGWVREETTAQQLELCWTDIKQRLSGV